VNIIISRKAAKTRNLNNNNNIHNHILKATNHKTIIMTIKISNYIKLLYFFSITLLLVSCNQPKHNGNNSKQNIIDSTKAAVKEVIIETKFEIPVDDYSINEYKVKSGETFSVILNKVGLSYSEIRNQVQASKDIFDVRYIREGKKYFTFNRKDSSAKTDYLIYKVNKVEYIKFDFRDSLLISTHELEIRIDTNHVRGTIESSLWVSMKRAGISPILSMELSDIYAWTIDFYGLQKGDSYNVIYEKKYIDSTFIGLGRVIACDFNSGGHNYYAYLFKQDSLEDYFDEEGGSLRRAFLKAPLKFSRISSRFSNNRLHPVLKIRRPHHGVDYAAPTGTPVHTIGDGKVIFIGRKGGYGKKIEIKHNGTYTTGYAHLSRYAKGLKKGDFVKQGTTIGYVGSTGLATGPHLDFRVYKSGTPIDPLKMKSPPAVPIKKEYKVKYEKKKEWCERELGNKK